MPVFWTRDNSVRGRSKNCYWKTKLQGRENGGDQTLPIFAPSNSYFTEKKSLGAPA